MIKKTGLSCPVVSEGYDITMPRTERGVKHDPLAGSHASTLLVTYSKTAGSVGI